MQGRPHVPPLATSIAPGRPKEVWAPQREELQGQPASQQSRSGPAAGSAAHPSRSTVGAPAPNPSRRGGGGGGVHADARGGAGKGGASTFSPGAGGGGMKRDGAGPQHGGGESAAPTAGWAHRLAARIALADTPHRLAQARPEAESTVSAGRLIAEAECLALQGVRVDQVGICGHQRAGPGSDDPVIGLRAPVRRRQARSWAAVARPQANRAAGSSPPRAVLSLGTAWE